MERKKHFKSTKELLDFLRARWKRFEAYSKKEDEKLEKEKKAWEEYERSYDLELEKKKHAAYLKNLQKILKEQKAMVEKAERFMRKSEKRDQSKTRKYNLVTSESKSTVAEQVVKYKSKKK
jgi:hypothetical protein